VPFACPAVAALLGGTIQQHAATHDVVSGAAHGIWQWRVAGQRERPAIGLSETPCPTNRGSITPFSRSSYVGVCVRQWDRGVKT